MIFVIGCFNFFYLFLDLKKKIDNQNAIMNLERYALEKYMRNVQYQRATISLCVVIACL